MNEILNPFSGLCNPFLGQNSLYLDFMTGKKVKVSGEVRRVFAENVMRLMFDRFPLSTNRYKALALAAGISLSSVQRATSGETAPNLDTVEAIAAALKVSPSSLLVMHRGEDRRTGTNN